LAYLKLKKVLFNIKEKWGIETRKKEHILNDKKKLETKRVKKRA
jgi:hypothetical protein